MTTRTVEYLTPTASCGGCRDNIAGAFTDVGGVSSAVLDLDTKHTAITFDPALVGEDELVRVLTDAGYPPTTQG